jgi:RES domain-containing protein
MRVWRLTRAIYQKLDGEGARRFGGRWNSVGHPMVYTSSHLSLAVLEYRVNTTLKTLPGDLVAMEIDIPDPIDCKDLAPLPSGWRDTPAPRGCQLIGDEWLQTQSSLLAKVPSAVIPVENNYLLNPEHAEMASITVVNVLPFPLDERLFGP